MIYNILSIISKREFELKPFVVSFITGSAAIPFYYIIALVQLTVLTPFLINALESKHILAKALWCVSPVYLAFLYVYIFITGGQPPLYATVFPAWLIFYYLGLYIRINRSKLLSVIKYVGKLRYVIICAVSCIVETRILMRFGISMGIASSQIKLSGFVFSFILILYLLNKAEQWDEKKKQNLRTLAYIGDRSYGIFLIHCLILIISNKMCDFLCISSIWWLSFISCLMIGLVGSIIAVNIVNLIAKKLKVENIVHLIGFNIG